MSTTTPIVVEVTATSDCEAALGLCTYKGISFPVTLTAIDFLLYGVYLVLYVISVFVLLRRKRGRYFLQCVAITTLFLLATAGIVLKTVISVLAARRYMWELITLFQLRYTAKANTSPPFVLQSPDRPAETINGIYTLYLKQLSYTRAVQVITVLANLITDAILLWRCYLVWGRRLKAIVLPITLSTISNVLGFLTVAFTSPESIEAVTDPGDTLLLSEVLSTDDFYLLHPKTAPNGLSQLKMNDFTLQSTILISFVAGSIISNLLLTSMIAGRILYINHEVSKLVKCIGSARRMYRTAITATLESGLLYPLSLLLYGACMLKLGNTAYNSNWKSRESWDLASTVLYYSLLQVLGIAPTLIIVRTALGITVHDEKTFRETILGDFGLSGEERTVIDIRRGSDTMSMSVFSKDELLENDRSKDSHRSRGQSSLRFSVPVIERDRS